MKSDPEITLRWLVTSHIIQLDPRALSEDSMRRSMCVTQFSDDGDNNNMQALNIERAETRNHKFCVKKHRNSPARGLLMIRTLSTNPTNYFWEMFAVRLVRLRLGWNSTTSARNKLSLSQPGVNIPAESSPGEKGVRGGRKSALQTRNQRHCASHGKFLLCVACVLLLYLKGFWGACLAVSAKRWHKIQTDLYLSFLLFKYASWSLLSNYIILNLPYVWPKNNIYYNLCLMSSYVFL